MNKLMLILPLFLMCCNTEDLEKEKIQAVNTWYNEQIKDTMTLKDGHIYYFVQIYRSTLPVHSQYCKLEHY